MTFDPMDIALTLGTLTVLEIVLGIDNLIFLSIITSRLPQARQKIVRRVGIALAVIARFALLLAIMWIIKLKTPLFSLGSLSFSGRDLFMIGGGLFLVIKGSSEIYYEVMSKKEKQHLLQKKVSFTFAIIQIIIFDLLFSLDSIFTAVGLTLQLWIMMIAIGIAAMVMLVSAGLFARVIKEHPSIKMLALCFLLLIGVVLVMDGFGIVIPKGYIYVALAFSIICEMLNAYRRSRIK